MNPTRLKIILTTTLSFLFIFAYAQNSRNAQDMVSVNLSIVGKGSPAVCRKIDTSAYYLVTIDVFNTQDSAIKFWVMDDCWPLETFFMNSDSISFRSCFPGCEHSIPNQIVVAPKKTAQFYATIAPFRKGLSVPIVKVGFRYFSSVNDLWDFGTEKNKREKIKIYWSNEVELKDNLYSYEIK